MDDQDFDAKMAEVERHLRDFEADPAVQRRVKDEITEAFAKGLSCTRAEAEKILNNM